MGSLFIVSTPIGNLEDITIRAIKTLLTVNVIACEDTRRTSIFVEQLNTRFIQFLPETPEATNSRHGLNLSQRLISYYEEIEDKRIPEILAVLKQGKDVALVSDAGTPLVSDPGFKLVREAIKQGVNVVSIPGPSAVLTALTSSGLPTDKFFFLGFLPEKKSHRLKLFQNLLLIHRCISSTSIFYCAPHKLIQTLEDMKEAFGDIEIVIARELTKIHEEVWHGSLSEAAMYFSSPQGELVLLLHLIK